MKNILIFIIVAFVWQSCADKTGHNNKTENKKPKELNLIPGEFKSLIRPNERLELGKIYTDTVTYFNFDDNGDNGIFQIKKNKEVKRLIYNKENVAFVRGEELEIKWKIDSIRYAGDSEFLDFADFLVSAKKIKFLKLTDKKIKFLWRESRYIEDLQGNFNVIALDEKYIKTISEPEKAVLAYVATMIGNECEWDGEANEERSNLKCKILWALGLGYQCSNNHLGFLRQWFRNDKEVLKELETCPTTPDGATIQDTFDEINIEVKDNKISVFFKANGINLREGRSWNWTEKVQFVFKENELILLHKDVSPIEHNTFDVRGN